MTDQPDHAIVSAIRDHEIADAGRHQEIRGLLDTTARQSDTLLSTVQAGTTAQIEMAAILRARDERDREDREAARKEAAESAAWWRRTAEAVGSSKLVWFGAIVIAALL